MLNHEFYCLNHVKSWWNHGEISISNSSITIFVAPGAPRMAHGWPACHTRWAPRRRAAPRPRRWRRGATLARWAQPSRQPRHCAPWRWKIIGKWRLIQHSHGIDVPFIDGLPFLNMVILVGNLWKYHLSTSNGGLSLDLYGKIMGMLVGYTLWLFNIAMGNGP